MIISCQPDMSTIVSVALLWAMEEVSAATAVGVAEVADRAAISLCQLGGDLALSIARPLEDNRPKHRSLR